MKFTKTYTEFFSLIWTKEENGKGALIGVVKRVEKEKFSRKSNIVILIYQFAVELRRLLCVLINFP